MMLQSKPLCPAFIRLNACFLFIFLLCYFSGAAQSNAGAKRYPLLPYPTHLEAQSGFFTLSPQTEISGSSSFSNEIEQLQQLVKEELGKSLPVKSGNSRSAILFTTDASLSAEEGYTLSIKPNSITIAAKTPAGAFRAVETIRQLLPVTAVGSSVQIPCVYIKDQPLYSWRGMHLDVARHFFSIGYLKKFMDMMALYKMNKFHLHLTDDQGWRIEIKQYPKLTEQGAWRTFDKNDSDCIRRSAENPDMAIDSSHIITRNGQTLYGGFYTQEQIKDLVAYAATKHIDIVPEIDMPGHMMAAIHAYPFLSCTGGSNWGELFSTPICPCEETTFEFAQNVFTEVMNLFPSKYIHLGADEVDRKTWAQSPACGALMKKEGLKDVAELQSYFVKRMEKFFQSKGRELIGWDEILEGGVSPTAIVMYWRGWVPKAPIEAAQHGNKVIMTPGDPLYFDNPPNNHSLSDIYHFSVVPKGLNSKEAKFILGAQANTWTEHVPSENRADYLTMPRMTALSERLWTGDKGDTGYRFYQERLQQQYPRLDALHIHYRLPDLTGLVQENVFVDSAVLSVTPPLPDMKIHYTTDGSLPGTNSAELNHSLTITKDETIKLAAFTTSARGDLYTLHYKKENYAEPVMAANAFPGLHCNYYKAYFKNVAAFQSVTPDSSFTIDTIVVPETVHAPSFAMQYTGFINIPQTGIYSFYLTCDDGGILSIAGKTVVDNDGLHSAIEKSGQIALEKGYQPLKLDFIEGGGGYKLELMYSTPETPEHRAVPKSWLMHSQ